MLAIDKAYMDTCAHITHMHTETWLESHENAHLVPSPFTLVLLTTKGTTVALKHSSCNYLDFIWLGRLASKAQGCPWLFPPCWECRHVPSCDFTLALEIVLSSGKHSKPFAGSHLPSLSWVVTLFSDLSCKYLIQLRVQIKNYFLLLGFP